MAGNTFGTLFRLTTFGESHGVAVGGIIDGCPAGLHLDLDRVAAEMARRRPGQSALTTSRNETDEVEFLSGLLQGVTLGTPIGFLIRNQDQRPVDYDALKDAFRPSHADFTYQTKYGLRDARGGGRSSARETVARVVAGAVAKQLLEKFNIRIGAYVSQVGDYKMEEQHRYFAAERVDQSSVRCPDPKAAAAMQHYIERMRDSGDTCGGTITGIIEGLPVGIGEPVFDKLSAMLAAACMSINAAHGFEFGSGFGAVSMKGSDHNDAFVQTDDGIRTVTNHSGGIQGGISNGMLVNFNVAFKPVATVMRPVDTINTNGDQVTIDPKGRHDPCVVPRAVPIVEAMVALVVTDLILRDIPSQLSRLQKLF